MKKTVLVLITFALVIAVAGSGFWLVHYFIDSWEPVSYTHLDVYKRQGRDPINPHIWDYNGRLEWYRPISQEQRSQIANTILDYVGMYQEETEENDFTMKL